MAMVTYIIGPLSSLNSMSNRWSFKDGLSFALVMLFVCVYVTGG